MMDRCIGGARRMVSGLFLCTGVFVAMQLLFGGVLVMDWPIWYGEPLELFRRYFMIPWGFSLGVVCLMERSRAEAKTRVRYLLLVAFLLWAIVPFGLRFGLTFNNVTSWYNAFVTVVSVYMMTNWVSGKERAKSLDAACMLLLAVSLVWGALLLFCAANAQAIELSGNYVFGIETKEWGSLCGGMHYNTTGMIAVCLFFINICGLARSRYKAVKAVYGAAAAMMAVVTVLTQSRTARYSLLIASAFAAFGWAYGRLGEKKLLTRGAAAFALAGIVLVGGYVLADALTNEAIQSYTEQGIVTKALAEEEKKASADQPAEEPDLTVRSAGDASFSGRKKIWENTIAYWKNNPKYFVIGCGVGKISSRIVEGTIHEKQGSVMIHNGYLQITADYGLIGALLYFGFFACMVRPVLGAVFAAKGRGLPGQRALAGLVVATLFTGFMESVPFAPLSAMNLMMFYAFGILSADVEHS